MKVIRQILRAALLTGWLSPLLVAHYFAVFYIKGGVSFLTGFLIGSAVVNLWPLTDKYFKGFTK